MAAPALDVDVRLAPSGLLLDDADERFRALAGWDKIYTKDDVAQTNACAYVGRKYTVKLM